MKEIKDYLHFYFGCRCKYKHQEKKGLINIHKGVGMWRLVTIHYLENSVTLEAKGCMVVAPMNEVKPILRPLSDMTEEELRHCCKILGAWIPVVIYRRIKGDGWAQWYYVFDNREEIVANLTDDEKGFGIWRGNNYFHVHKEIVLYLLKQQVDLFGLIEAGIAIDKTKQHDTSSLVERRKG